MSPKLRLYLYVAGTVAFAGLSVLSTFKIIDPNTASTVSAALTSVLGLFGVTVAGTAAYNTNKQKHEGVFDKHDPADLVVNGINAVLEAQQQAQAQVDRVKEAVGQAVKDVPVLGPLAKEALDRLV